MRVLCSAIDGNDIVGGVTSGEKFDRDIKSYDLGQAFTLRLDDGRICYVHGWLVDVTVLEARPGYIM